jgi:molybdenum cofactor guanylyltransferase
MPLLGAILAGGASSRMGRDKAEVVVGGLTMLQRVAEALAAVTDRVVVLGPEKSGYECWPDESAAGGPLSGIATVLGRMNESRALVVGVDSPFVSASTLSHLAAIEGALPVVPVDDDGVRQVTCAVYPATVSAAAADEAAAGGSVQTLLDRVSFMPVTPATWRAWGEDGRSWHSVDTPESIVAAESLFGL